MPIDAARRFVQKICLQSRMRIEGRVRATVYANMQATGGLVDHCAKLPSQLAPEYFAPSLNANCSRGHQSCLGRSNEAILSDKFLAHHLCGGTEECKRSYYRHNFLMR